jgi:hypothetical protein
MPDVNMHAIKGYELLELIGEGIYGMVYYTRQQINIRR